MTILVSPFLCAKVVIFSRTADVICIYFTTKSNKRTVDAFDHVYTLNMSCLVGEYLQMYILTFVSPRTEQMDIEFCSSAVDCRNIK